MSKVCPESSPYPVITNQPYRLSGEQKRLNAAAGLVLPTGLECLTSIDQVVVKPRCHPAEPDRTIYKMVNSLDQHIFEAQEVADDNCCVYGPARPSEINIRDVGTRKVFIHLKRPFRGMCCCMCCLQEIVVTAPFAGNQLLGYVIQQPSFTRPRFIVKNAENTPIFTIKGPKWANRCCSEGDFNVLTEDGFHDVGHIRKKWKGFAPEAIIDRDNFGVKFPMDLDDKMKATLLGAAFLIDFLYFEIWRCGTKWL